MRSQASRRAGEGDARCLGAAAASRRGKHGGIGQAEADQQAAGVLDELSSRKRSLGAMAYALLFMDSDGAADGAENLHVAAAAADQSSRTRSLISASVGCGFLSSSAFAVSTQPFRQ